MSTAFANCGPPGQRKRKKRTGEDAERQGRIHTRFKNNPANTVQTGATTRRQPTAPGHGDGLLRFFERRSRIHSEADDVKDIGLASAIEDPDSEVNAGGAPQPDTQAAINRLVGSLDPDAGDTHIPPVGGGSEGALHLPTDEVGPCQERDSSLARCTSVTFLGTTHLAEDVDTFRTKP